VATPTSLLLRDHPVVMVTVTDRVTVSDLLVLDPQAMDLRAEDLLMADHLAADFLTAGLPMAGRLAVDPRMTVRPRTDFAASRASDP
jgi:hypothetical protein